LLSHPAQVAGVDSSTQGTKVLVVDADRGSAVCSGQAGHAVSAGMGRSESDPADWLRSLQEALAQTGRAGELAAVSVAGQQHGLVCLSADRLPLRPAILWTDVRSGPWRERLVERLGGPSWWAGQLGSVPATSFTVCHWARLREVEPETASATRAVRLPHEFITEVLSGRPVGDRGDASGTGWWSPISNAYVPSVLESAEVGLDSGLLAEVLAEGEVAGPVTASSAGRFGLDPDCLVAQGTGDNMAAALGLALRPGQVAMSLGTSGTAFTLSRTLAPDASGVVSGFADAQGGYLPLVCTLNCTRAIDRVAEWLGIDREAVEDGGRVVVLPFLDGERTPALPGAHGLVAGLDADATRGQILWAAYLGAVVSLLDGIASLAAASGGLAPAEGILLVGGGGRSRAWRRAAAWLSERPLLVPGPDDAALATARGACAQAAAAWGGASVADVLQSWPPLRVDTIEPMEGAGERLGELREARSRLLEASLTQLSG
jgi:xylulokinase